MLRSLLRWLPEYIRTRHQRRAPRSGEPVELLLCVCDHFEPKLGAAPPAQAQARVARWVSEYPKLFANVLDSDGRPPQHTFFYPAEEYEPEYLDALANLCRAGFGEVEIHLHHDNDTPDNLRRTLTEFRDTLAHRHGLLARDPQTGAVKYGFIHGNWALNNSLPSGRHCGINDEIRILHETGCYADFTLPSAPSPAQTRTINSIYYAQSDPHRPTGHDRGQLAGTGTPSEGALLLIQGPLLFDWGRRKWGLMPRVENACLQGNQAPSLRRLELWLRARVRVPQRPDWFFVKLHTHGANEKNMPVLLGDAMVQFHAELAERARRDTHFRYHYVTARELANLVHAAEAGWTGSVDAARNHHWTTATATKQVGEAPNRKTLPKP